MDRFWSWFMDEKEPVINPLVALVGRMAEEIHELRIRVAALETRVPVAKTFPVGPLMIDWEEAERRNLAKLEEADGSHSSRR